MPMHDTIACGPGAWTPASDGAVEAVRAQCVEAEPAWLQATLTDTPPASQAGALQLFRHPGLALDHEQPLSAFFAGVGAGPYYLWLTAAAPTSVSVSHG